MKLRNIIASFLAVVAIAVGCTEELTGNLSSIKLDQSTIVFPEQGSSVTITVTAATDWSVDAATVPAEVTVTPMSGKAGETKMTIATNGGSVNDIASDIVILVGNQKQFIKFYQPGDPSLRPQFEEFTAGDYWIMCKEGADWFALKSTGCTIDDGGSYNYLYSVPAVVAGDGSLSSTASNVFTFEAVDGGFIIKDPAGGYLYQVAKYHNFYLTSDKAQASVWTVTQTSEDEFMVEIPSLSKWMQYSTSYDSAGAYPTAQDGATLPKLVKAEAPAAEPFVIEETEFDLSIDGGELLIPVTYNGTDIHVDGLPSWMNFYGYHEGNIKFTYEANTAGNREAVVVLTTCMEDGREATVELTFKQEGAIIETTADQINAAEDGATLYRVTGVVKSIVKAEYGNLYIADYTGEVYVYGTYDADGNRFDAFATPVKEGDIITVCGVKTSYNGSPQMKNVTMEKHIQVTPVSVSEFLAASEASDVYYSLTGAISGLDQAGAYGNVYISDDSDKVYVYGLLSGWGGPKKQFASLVEKTGLAEGDIVTIVGVRTSHKETPQVGSAFYVSHESAGQGGEEPEQPGDNSEVKTLTNAEICAAMTSSETSYVEYTIESASGVWTVNASQLNTNTFLQCRGRKGSYIKTPAFEKDIKSVTIHFSEAKSAYANNTYCAFPAAWTAPAEDAAYPEDGNVGKAVTDGSYSLTIPVNAGNKQVCISMTGGTYTYYLDHIDVEF